MAAKRTTSKRRTQSSAGRERTGRPALRRRLTAALALLVALLGTGACQTTQVPMNQPLPNDAAERPDFARNYGFGRFLADQRAGTAAWSRADSDLLVFLAFSGGGKRSAAFAHGVLRGLRDIPVRPPGTPERTLLDDVDYISSVSGGSFPAMHYGLHRERSFETFPQEFLKTDVNSYIYGMFLKPWNWEWMVNPLYGTNDYMAGVYDRLMFHGATYGDLARRGPPIISVNATDIANEASFAFLGSNFGLLCSDMTSFPVARAVAASNGFPVLFTPVTLENHAAHCRGQRPPTAPRAAWAEPRSELSRRAQMARLANRYADPERTRWVHLMDGGIADNLALRGLLNVFIGFGMDESSLVRFTARHTRRILVVSVDGEAAADPTLGQQRVVGGVGRVFSAVSGTQIDTYNFETLVLAEERVQTLAKRFRVLRCAMGPVIDGHPCGDVEGALVHISLSGIDDPAARARLEAIPTGLTIPDADVDALVSFGERIARDNPTIRAVAAAAGPGRGEVQAPHPQPRRGRVAAR
jgi:NTE family protein